MEVPEAPDVPGGMEVPEAPDVPLVAGIKFSFIVFQPEKFLIMEFFIKAEFFFIYF
jgi:hypothetical protein